MVWMSIGLLGSWDVIKDNENLRICGIKGGMKMGP